MSPRDAAVAAARRGWAVFPCLPWRKRPAVEDRWEDRACADPELVARYWPSDQHNAGVACGPSGLVVIDLDTHGSLPEAWRLPGIRDGLDVLAQLCEWASQPWPTTCTTQTPLGGQHLIFKALPGREIRNSAGKIGPMIDVRASGGYILAAGSVLDGRAYPKDPEAARVVRGGKAYKVIDPSEAAPLPSWLATLASHEPSPDRTGARETGTPEGRMRGLVATVRAGQRGDRNGPLYWSACRAAEMIAAGQVDRSMAEDLLVSAALEAGLRGGEREARRTFASAMRGVTREPVTYAG
ncbi:MAG TPA: bifunctional DNA primase/polymerase [Streptosporangiaceae bacterium]|nr:bifunctional DNA primase/polymerase [Streptosporangiaceae bacterium]